MTHPLARIAMLVLVFVALPPLLCAAQGPPPGYGGPTPGPDPTKYIQHYPPPAPPQGTIDKSVMSNYGSTAPVYNGFREQFFNELQVSPGFVPDAISEAKVIQDELNDFLLLQPNFTKDQNAVAFQKILTEIQDFSSRLKSQGNLLDTIDALENSDRKLIEEFPGETLSIGLGEFQQGQSKTTIFPELTYSNGLSGYDLGFQEYLQAAPGYSVSAKYYPEPQRRNLSFKLTGILQKLRKLRTEADSFHTRSEQIRIDLDQLDQGPSPHAALLEIGDLISNLNDLEIVKQRADAVLGSLPPRPDLDQVIVDASVGLQTDGYVVGRQFNDLGLYTAEGMVVGQLVPLERLHLGPIQGGHAAVTPFAQIQAVQFDTRTPYLPSEKDLQYGFSLVWQDMANGFQPKAKPVKPAVQPQDLTVRPQIFTHLLIIDPTDDSPHQVDDKQPNQPAIRPWHTKIGFDYYSKAFSGDLRNPVSRDFYLRFRIVGPAPVEIKPYGGWAGQEHKWYRGVDLSITVPLAF